MTSISVSGFSRLTTSIGQVQGHTTPCASVTVAATSVAPVSQFSDGQIQVTPAPAPAPAPTGEATAIAPGAPASGVPNGTTLRTSVPPPPPSVVPTKAPTPNGVGRFQLSSALALVVGLGCAILAL